VSDPSDPWRKTTPPPAGRGPFLWLLILAVVGVVVWLLAGEFPEAAASTDGKLRLIYLFLLVAILSSGLLARRRIRFRIAAKYTAIWAAIVLVLMLGYGYRFELRSVGQRLVSEILPHRANRTGDRTLSVRAGPGGHFRLEAIVDGVPVRFLVDTGATRVVLSPSDARRLGFETESLAYTHSARTANGVVATAPVTLGEIAIGPLRVKDVQASVNRSRMTHSLLGMSFLGRLRGFGVEEGSLTFSW